MFNHCKSQHKEIVLPKAFLQQIKFFDLDKDFARYENDDMEINYLLDKLHYGKDLERVKKLRAAKSSQDKLGLQLYEKTKPYEKRVWLIDRRNITTDSVTLLEVLAGRVIH